MKTFTGMLHLHSHALAAAAALASAALPLGAEPEPVDAPQPPPPAAPAPEEDGYVRAGRATVQLLNELTGVLNGVHDRETADAAVPRVQEISGRLQELRRQTRELPKPRPSQEEFCKKHLGDREARAAVQGLMISLLNLAQTQAYGSEELLDALTKMVSESKL